ncbi:MAG: arsenic resistance protein [Gammaproteobacteria bacterium]|jgi:arsenite transporter|nr:arsenic resistance protein [Gammaproteobacteria bacterium]MCH2559352.1 arsenic resistance protein [Alcanivorax sp.]PHS68265.1 MAG: bile acid:sodium symporter [Alcanivorax sp.]
MREKLEKHQAWLYLAAVLSGMAIGRIAPGQTGSWEQLLWPALGVLLYATFIQVPLVHLGMAFRDRRFLAALLTGNFILMPLVVGALLPFLPDEPAIRLGVLLVLLVPCTDWFISFTHLGGGDGTRAIAAAPVLLIAQLILLPAYIWLFMGDVAIELTLGSHLLPAFFGLIVIPLLLAWWTERLTETHPLLQTMRSWLGWVPVPVLALVIFLIAGSQVRLVTDNAVLLPPVLFVFVFYLVAAALIGKGLQQLCGFKPAAGRTLAFSFGTRNSFVMLPLALSLPEVWRAAVVVIVFQSLVELFGMVAYLRWLPRLIQGPTESQAVGLRPTNSNRPSD